MHHQQLCLERSLRCASRIGCASHAGACYDSDPSRCEAPNKTCHSPLSVSYAGSSVMVCRAACGTVCVTPAAVNIDFVQTRRITVSGRRELIPVSLQGRIEACKASNIERTGVGTCNHL
jgi:hypothetical protein